MIGIVIFVILITHVSNNIKSGRKNEEKRMRVTRERAAQNREEMLGVAARLFREQGIDATGVDSISEAAGLTHGAVYSRFGSKEAIAVEAIRRAFKGSLDLWRHVLEGKRSTSALAAVVRIYLSAEHRDHVGRGCVVAALGGEIARQPAQVRETFTAELKGVLELLAAAIPRESRSRRYDDAIFIFAALVGGLILARAVSDRGLSDRILRASAAAVLRLAQSRRSGRRALPSAGRRRFTANGKRKRVN